MFHLPKRDGRIVMPRGERAVGIIFAPILIIFFSYVRTELVALIGHGLVDTAVRIFLEEMYVTFTLFTVLTFVWCIFQPRWIERLLEFSIRKLVLLFQTIMVVPYLILIAAAALNLLQS